MPYSASSISTGSGTTHIISCCVRKPNGGSDNRESYPDHTGWSLLLPLSNHIRHDAIEQTKDNILSKLLQFRQILELCHGE